jgi:hypothetical protein
MSSWVNVITAGSLDAFVIGALVSAACFIAIVVSWRVYRREPADRDPETVTAGLEMFRDDKAGRDAEPAGPDRFGDDTVIRGPAVAAAGLDGPPGDEAVAPGEDTPPRERGPWLTVPAEPGSRKRQARAGSHRAPHALGDPTLADGMPKPPGARRPPRHAAPSARLGGKKNGVSLANGSRG